MTNAGSTSWLYDYHRANNAENLPTLQALRVSHEPSPWMGDRRRSRSCRRPPPARRTPTRTARALPFSHENEVARAHYYGVTFDNGLKAEIAPTDHAAVLRFTFPAHDGNLIFDNVNDDGGLTLDAGDPVVQRLLRRAQRPVDGATRMFIYGTLDRPVTASGKLPVAAAGRHRLRQGRHRRERRP